MALFIKSLFFIISTFTSDSISYILSIISNVEHDFTSSCSGNVATVGNK